MLRSLVVLSLVYDNMLLNEDLCRLPLDNEFIKRLYSEIDHYLSIVTCLLLFYTRMR